MSTVEYSGNTKNFSAIEVADGGFIVTVKQVKELDKYRDPHGFRQGSQEEEVREVAVDRAELRDIFNRCFPK